MLEVPDRRSHCRKQPQGGTRGTRRSQGATSEEQRTETGPQPEAHRGFHVALPSETWCTVMVHLGTIANYLHMLWKTALFSLPPLDLTTFSQTSLVDIALGLVLLCLRGLQASDSTCPVFAYRRWPLVVASRPASQHPTRLLVLALRLSRSCHSMPPATPRRAGGWHLRRQPSVEYFLYVPLFCFPCGSLTSVSSVSQCLDKTPSLRADVEHC